MTISTEVQKLDGDAIVSMYILDLTPIGGSNIFRFTTMPNEDTSPLIFDSETYTPIDIEATGFRWDGQGAFPRPKLTISNISGVINSAIIAFGDIVGASFTRYRTFAKHLDNGSDPDPSAMFPPEIYTLNQRTEHNSVFVTYEMRSTIDQPSISLPGRVCLRDVCTHTYRIWDAVAGDFDYSNATCPYVAAASFTESNVATSSSNDDCGRSLDACKARFGEEGLLPTRAFPGISKTSI